MRTFVSFAFLGGLLVFAWLHQIGAMVALVLGTILGIIWHHEHILSAAASDDQEV